MRLLTATLIAASSIALSAFAPSRPEAQADLSLRVIFADPASGIVETLVSPAPHILMETAQGKAPAAGDVLNCTMADGQLLDCGSVTLQPRGFVLSSRPPDTWVRRAPREKERSNGV